MYFFQLTIFILADSTSSEKLQAFRIKIFFTYYIYIIPQRIFNFLPFSKNFIFCILHTILNMCVNFQGNLIFFSWKIELNKKLLRFTNNAFLVKMILLHKIVCLFVYYYF